MMSKPEVLLRRERFAQQQQQHTSPL